MPGVRHGWRYHPTYKIRNSIIQRCCNPEDVNFPSYGGRGIKICSLWRKYPAEFCEWALNHGWELGLEIDRIHNDKGYYPSNCRFTTKSVSQSNKRPYSSTGYVGVYKNKSKYQAELKGKDYVYVGRYKTAREAAVARDLYIIKHRLDRPVQTVSEEYKERWNKLRVTFPSMGTSEKL